MARIGDGFGNAAQMMADREPKTICFPFVGDLVGGSHISARGLIQGLDRSRFRPLVLVQNPEGRIGRFFHEAGIAVEQSPHSLDLIHGRPVSAFAGARLATGTIGLARFLRRRSVDLVHSNDGRTHATWALAARIAGARLLWHHRGAPDAVGLRLAAPLLATRVVAVSRFASPRAGLYSAARRTHVIHSPFDTAQRHDRVAARAEICAELGIPHSTPVIAFSGVLIDRKRPLLFVRAIAALRRAAPELDVRGLVLGDSHDDMAEQVRAEAERLDAGDAIHLMGFRTPGARWIAGCDILMVPAVSEPFGRTLIEAMLVGTPVVATASGGNVEAIRDGATGRLVEPEDEEALAVACLDLLRHPDDARSIASLARNEALTRFGEASHVDAVMALYDQMLKHPQRPSTH